MEKKTLGHVFHPSLTDISLKRFRLRYNTYDDVYYVHWDKNVCAALSKYEGLARGLFSASKMERHLDNKDRMAYLSPCESSESSYLEWCVDFSTCGLVVLNAKIKIRHLSHDVDGVSGMSEGDDETVSFLVHGDNKSWTTYDLTDEYVELDGLYGSKTIRIMVAASPPTSSHANDTSVRFMSCQESESCPLDLMVELMCPRPREAVYCGELLLGIKFDPDKSDVAGDSTVSNGHGLPSSSPSSSSDVSPDDQTKGGGELQVHVIEGAGLIDQDTHKPFKTAVKCEIIPDLYGKYPVKHTTTKHNAYPTWTENLIFNGVTRDHLARGALEVVLYDHHHFSSDQTIGGLRLCVPMKKESVHFVYSLSSPPTSPLPPTSAGAAHSGSVSPVIPDSVTPQTSGSVSPVSNVSAHSADERQQQQGTLQLHTSDVRSKSKSLPRLGLDPLGQSSLDNSPSSSPSSKTPLLSQIQPHHRVASNPNVTRDGDDLSSSGNNRHSSPITLAKHLFNMTTLKNSLSPSYGSPKNSPRSSPLLGRKRFRGPRSQGGHEDRDSHLMYWWMESVKEGESRHWKQVLDHEGEWCYYWHSIHYRLQPAYS